MWGIGVNRYDVDWLYNDITDLLKSRMDLTDDGMLRSGQVMKLNWVTVLVSLVCKFFK